MTSGPAHGPRAFCGWAWARALVRPVSCVLCPMSYVICSMCYVLCPMAYVLCPVSYGQGRLLDAQGGYHRSNDHQPLARAMGRRPKLRTSSEGT